MSEVDDWAPVKQAAAQDDWAPVAQPIDPMPDALQSSVPEAFLDRVRAGQALTRITQAAGKEAETGFGQGTPTGFEDETLNHLIDLGVFHDPAKGRGGPIQMINEAVMIPTAKIWEGIGRSMAGGIHGAAGAFGQVVDEFGGSQGQANRAKNEVINAGNWAMIEGGFGRFSRPSIDGARLTDKVVGGLPVQADFTNAAKVLAPEKIASAATRVEGEVFSGVNHGETTEAAAKARGMDVDTFIDKHTDEQVQQGFVTSHGRFVSRNDALDIAKKADQVRSGPDAAWWNDGKPGLALPEGGLVSEVTQNIETNLKRMWQEDGIHPAEAVHDAERDAFLKHDIVTKQEPVKLDAATEEILTETGGKPGSLGAAATEPGDIPLAVQPPSPPGRLAAAFKDAGDKLFDMGRDAQMLTSPMAAGTRDSIALAKDFANSVRRNRWDWSRIDEDIQKRFTPEQRTRMWNAADEESTSRQLGEPEHMREHQGLATLEPAERAAVDEMQTRAQNAWLRARDLGMVEGEGLPAYTPRMVINTASALAEDKALPLNSIGNNLKVRTGQMLRRKHLEASETEAAAKAKYGDQAELVRDIRTLPMATAKLEDAVAGRTLINSIKEYGARTGADTVVEGAIPAGTDAKFFTLDHPAFKTWRPKFAEIEGKVQAVKDAEGNTVFEQVPIYVHGDFEGPLRAVLNQKSGAVYGGLMALKGKTMSLIMNSPMIHNAVEWGRALPAMPGKVASFKVYFEGNRAKNDVALMHEAIDNGLVPIGHRFFNQDISGLMENPNLTPGRSWTSQILAAVPGLFDEGAGTAVKRAVDKAGDFWHNTLLWDRVADLQMGLYTNFKADAIAKGIDPTTASRMAAHWANRYAGALPKEAMSDAATKVSNMLLFSRSFTMGNLGVIKDMLTGLPKDVLSQIERDAGFRSGSIEAAGEEGAAAVDYSKSLARRKAMSVVLADMVLFYAGNSVLQSALNIMFQDSTMDKELHGYAERFMAKMQAVKEHPLELIQPLNLLQSLSSTSENEPNRQDRIRVGTAANGTAIYARNPAGKIGEEFIGYMTGPLDMMRRKMGTIARPAWQVMSNDAGFGRKVYDPDADTPGKYLANLGRIAAHLAGSQLPTGQIGAFSDLVKGEGDKKVNLAQAFGPFLGVTFAKGAPGGPAVGEMYAARAQHDFAVQNAMPDIRRQIQRGDVSGAQDRMDQLGVPAGLQRFYVRTTLNPETRLSTRALRDFYRYATPEQRRRMERSQQAPQPQ